MSDVLSYQSCASFLKLATKTGLWFLAKNLWIKMRKMGLIYCRLTHFGFFCYASSLHIKQHCSRLFISLLLQYFFPSFQDPNTNIKEHLKDIILFLYFFNLKNILPIKLLRLRPSNNRSTELSSVGWGSHIPCVKTRTSEHWKGL